MDLALLPPNRGRGFLPNHCGPPCPALLTSALASVLQSFLQFMGVSRDPMLEPGVVCLEEAGISERRYMTVALGNPQTLAPALALHDFTA